MKHWPLAGGIAAALLASAIACSSFEGDENGGSASKDDGGTTGDGTTSGGPTSGCPTIFVNATGKSDAKGCEQATPVPTITQALVRAKEAGASEVRVCSGTYDEQALTLDARISLRGGYDCATWERTKAETRITRLGTGTALTTLVITGAAVTREVEIDGFAIDGPEKGVTGTAVRIANGARPLLHDLQLTGGATSASTSEPGALVLDIQGGSAPEVKDTRLNGGFGTANVATPGEVGTVGIRVRESSPKLHDLTIESTAGTTQRGVVVAKGGNVTGENALQRITMNLSGADSDAAGLVVEDQGTLVELRDSTLEIGRMTCTRNDRKCSARVVYATGGTVSALANRLIGGEIPDGKAESVCAGIIAAGATVDVENNLILAGNEDGVSTFGSVGVWVGNSTGSRILYNTIAGATSSIDWYGITVSHNGKDVLIAGNLVASRSGNALAVDGCSGTVANLYGNVFVGHQIVLRTTNCDDMLPMNPVVTSSVEKQLGFQDDRKNRRLAANCTNDARCTTPPACSYDADCTLTFFSGGSTRASLKTAGWKPQATAPCSLVKPDYTPLAELSAVKTDVTSMPRTPPSSVGAVEAEACGD